MTYLEREWLNWEKEARTEIQNLEDFFHWVANSCPHEPESIGCKDRDCVACWCQEDAIHEQK